MFHPRNAVPILSWFDDPNDTALRDLIPAFQRLAAADDIYPVLAGF
jgi:RNA polymerase II subunit A small phosphatase-like protein